MESLRGRRILVTGGATGIGAAISERLARQGAHVIINYRTRDIDAETLRTRLADEGFSVSLARFDVTVQEQVRANFQAFAAGGGVHGLVHAAAAPLDEKRFRKASWEAFEGQWNVAVKGAFILMQNAIALQGSSRPSSVVFVTSSATLGVPPIENAGYVAAKYGLLGLARALSVELAAHGVRVNCVAPGFAETSLTAHVDERIKELIAKSIPFKRLTNPSDVAGVVAFLLSDSAAYVTGVNLPIAGGAVM